MSRRLFLGFLILVGILFPISIVPSPGADDLEVAGVESYAPSERPSLETPDNWHPGVDSVPINPTLFVQEGPKAR